MSYVKNTYVGVKANSEDLDQIAPQICTVCSDSSIPIFKVIHSVT